MQRLLRKMKTKTAINTTGRAVWDFYILELKCIKKDIYHSEIFIEFADFNLHTGYTIKLNQP